jgi:thiol peroxidase
VDVDDVAADRTKSRVKLKGPLVQVGQVAPDFAVVDEHFDTTRLSDSAGRIIILASVVSVDAPVCDTVLRKLRGEKITREEDWVRERQKKPADAGQKPREDEGQLEIGAAHGIELWVVSLDLPFALQRWREAAGIFDVKMLSDFRESSFCRSYGTVIEEGPFCGASGRALFVVGRDGKLRGVWYAEDLSGEPRYGDFINIALRLAADGIAEDGENHLR